MVDSTMKRTRFAELHCDSENPVVEIYDKKSEMLLEKGPVLYSEKESCRDYAGKADDRAVRNLVRNGEWVRYYSGSESILNRGEYVNGDKQGVWKIYSQDGDLVRTVEYAKGDKEGEEILYFPGTDIWRSRGRNHNGMKEGPWRERPAKDTDCISEGSYVHDEKSGSWSECRATGDGSSYYIGFRGNYDRGFKNGSTEFYHADGSIMAIGKYRINPACLTDGGPVDPDQCEFRSGAWVIRYPGGNTAMTGSYDPATGKKTGKWIEYYRSGQKMAEGTRDHVRKGWWDFFDKSGRLLYRFRFDGNDFSPVEAVLYENGKISGQGGLASTLVKYDSSKDELSISTIRKQGKWTLYEKGQKVGEGEMMMGRKQGKWTELVDGSWVTREYMLGRLK